MIYLVALFVPPLYFLLRKKWGGFLLSMILFSPAVVLLVSIILAPAGVFCWVVAAIHAIWHLRKELMREHAQMIADALIDREGVKNG